MKVYKMVTTMEPKVVDVICDLCGKSCNKSKDESEKGFEFAELRASWGYWSNQKDLTSHECIICEDCFDALPFRDKIRERCS